MFCVSIAMCLNGVPVIGIICAPLLDVTYSACAGYGAWMNDSTPSSPSSKQRKQLPLARNPVPPLPANAPSGCIFSCEWGKDRRDIPEGNMHRKVNSFMNMAAEIGGRGGKGGMVHGVRSLGRCVCYSLTFPLCCIRTSRADFRYLKRNHGSRIRSYRRVRYLVGRWLLGMVSLSNSLSPPRKYAELANPLLRSGTLQLVSASSKKQVDSSQPLIRH
jgi:hypothetical protein